MMRRRRYADLLGLSLTLLTLAACSVDVRGRDGNNGNAEVDVRTPAGNVSVRSDADEPADTGLPVYPGATLVRERGDSESANVNISAFGVGVRVAAAKFDSPDSNEKVLEFYRDAMKTYGEVTECRGEIDFKASRAVCEPSISGREMKLVVGREGDQRIVAVSPRGNGSEFGVVHVRVRE